MQNVVRLALIGFLAAELWIVQAKRVLPMTPDHEEAELGTVQRERIVSFAPDDEDISSITERRRYRYIRPSRHFCHCRGRKCHPIRYYWYRRAQIKGKRCYCYFGRICYPGWKLPKPRALRWPWIG